MNRLVTITAVIALAAFPDRGLAQTAEITNCPGQYSFSHCGVSLIDFDATGTGAISFELVSGPGQIDAATGVWSWFGSTVPQSGTDVVEVRAIDDNGPGAVCTVDIEVTNQAPTITCPGGVRTIYLGVPASQTVTVEDPDACDSPIIMILPGPDYDLSNVEIVGNEIVYDPLPPGRVVTMTVAVDDGELSQTCELLWNVCECGLPYAVSIEAKHDQFQGQFAEAEVVLHSTDFVEGMAGFDFLVGFDASALLVPSAVEGDVYAECGWEYFTYRTEDQCSGGCPSGLLRVVGIANINDGPAAPGCDSPDVGFVQIDQLPITLARLRFLVTNDRTMECQFAPVRFFWIDCGDNVISNHDGSALYLSQGVFDYVDDDNYPFIAGHISATDEFPTYFGTQDECIFNEIDKIAVRSLDLQNGGIGIICADVIDARGDINQNNIAFEIADVIMLTNYFLIGTPAFGLHVEGSIAASDTNADGLPLTVGDLVYLLRVVIGDVSPFDD